MGRVWWSAQAEADLESIDPAVRDQLRRNAEMILHDILPRTDPADEGTDGEIMWHRGDGHGRFTKRPNGPQDYFLIYRRCDPFPGSEDPDYEVLAVCSIHQVAYTWVQMTSTPAESGDPSDAVVLPGLSITEGSRHHHRRTQGRALRRPVIVAKGVANPACPATGPGPILLQSGCDRARRHRPARRAPACRAGRPPRAAPPQHRH